MGGGGVGVHLRKHHHKSPSSPISCQPGLFLASDVTGLLWWSLVTADYTEPGVEEVCRVGWHHWGKPCCCISPPPTHPPGNCTNQMQGAEHITVLDTALLITTPTSPNPSWSRCISLFLWTGPISFSIDCLMAIFHLSRNIIAGALEAGCTKNRHRSKLPLLDWCSVFSCYERGSLHEWECI